MFNVLKQSYVYNILYIWLIIVLFLLFYFVCYANHRSSSVQHTTMEEKCVQCGINPKYKYYSKKKGKFQTRSRCTICRKNTKGRSKQSTDSIKPVVTKCKDCGKRGHWRGDAQCTMKKTASLSISLAKRFRASPTQLSSCTGSELLSITDGNQGTLVHHYSSSSAGGDSDLVNMFCAECDDVKDSDCDWPTAYMAAKYRPEADRPLTWQEEMCYYC